MSDFFILVAGPDCFNFDPSCLSSSLAWMLYYFRSAFAICIQADCLKTLLLVPITPTAALSLLGELTAHAPPKLNLSHILLCSA